MTMARKWALLAVLPLLSLMGVVRGARLFWCPGDEVVRFECCCPQDGSAGQDSPTLESACCCDVTQLEPASPAQATSKETGLDRPLALASSVPAHVALDPGPSVGGVRLESTCPPPPIPILLRKQSFLI